MVEPQAEESLRWCVTCCTRHPEGGDCPGELVASGPDRTGWTAMVDTSSGRELFSVLLGPVGTLWRARVMTHPKSFWTVPGGSGAISFLGDDAEESQRQAVEYIEQECMRNGYRLVAQRSAGPAEQETSGGSRAKGAAPTTPPRRTLRSVPVRWGTTRPTNEGVTGDLSPGGVFILTRQPLEPGTPLQLQLELEGSTVPLRGVVQWKRERSEAGRPCGMGIRLEEVPALYEHYVRRLV